MGNDHGLAEYWSPSQNGRVSTKGPREEGPEPYYVTFGAVQIVVCGAKSDVETGIDRRTEA